MLECVHFSVCGCILEIGIGKPKSTIDMSGFFFFLACIVPAWWHQKCISLFLTWLIYIPVNSPLDSGELTVWLASISLSDDSYLFLICRVQNWFQKLVKLWEFKLLQVTKNSDKDKYNVDFPQYQSIVKYIPRAIIKCFS